MLGRVCLYATMSLAAAGCGTSEGHNSKANGDGGTRDASSDHSSVGDASADSAPHSAFQWQVLYDQSYAAHVEVDSTGAAVVSGTFFDTKNVTLGTTTLVSHGSADVMLSRILADGSVSWARGYGGASEDYPVSFALDGQDRITLVGLYNGIGNIGGPDFPAFSGASGRYDVYVGGLSPTGNYLWSATIATTADSFGGPGLSLGGQSAFVPGQFTGTATIGGTAHASAGSWDAYVARYDWPTGTFSNAATFGGTGDDRAIAALFTGTDVLVVGKFEGTVVFPTVPSSTSLTSNGGSDVFIARATTAGALTSVVSFGGTGNDVVNAARLDSAGNVVLGGVFGSPSLSVLGTKALVNAGADDVFIAKLDRSLMPLWAVAFGGDASDSVRDVAVGPSGTIALTGEFRDRITFGPNTWTASPLLDGGAPSEIDCFVAILDAQGAPVWSLAAGGPLPDRGLNVALDTQGGLYMTASFQSPIDFGGGAMTPTGGFASALVRFVP